MSRHHLASKQPGLSDIEKFEIAAGKRLWTEREDEFLVYYGPVVGYGVVAVFDLFRPNNSGKQRISRLRKTRPEFVAKIEKASGKPPFNPNLSLWQRWKIKNQWKKTITDYEIKAQKFRDEFRPPVNMTKNLKMCAGKFHKGTRYLPLKEFPRESGYKDRPATICQTCSNERVKRWISNNSERRRDIHHQSRYGITLRQRQEILKAQGGRCKICTRDFAAMPARAICLDHCHTTLVVRGILCRACNTMIGQAKDDPEVLRAAAAYLESQPLIALQRGEAA